LSVIYERFPIPYLSDNSFDLPIHKRKSMGLGIRLAAMENRVNISLPNKTFFDEFNFLSIYFNLDIWNFCFPIKTIKQIEKCIQSMYLVVMR